MVKALFFAIRQRDMFPAQMLCGNSQLGGSSRSLGERRKHAERKHGRKNIKMTEGRKKMKE
jgi:hypothetical protein